MKDPGGPILDPDSFGDCTTTTSFADHGVPDGSDLIQRTYYRLASDGTPEFEPTEDFFERLTAAFVKAYLRTAESHDVPDHVRAAIDDARVLTAEEFTDRPEADLRTEVLPRFYRHLAGFHCVYRV